jgi:hypothetical protein
LLSLFSADLSEFFESNVITLERELEMLKGELFKDDFIDLVFRQKYGETIDNVTIEQEHDGFLDLFRQAWVMELTLASPCRNAPRLPELFLDAINTIGANRYAGSMSCHSSLSVLFLLNPRCRFSVWLSSSIETHEAYFSSASDSALTDCLSRIASGLDRFFCVLLLLQVRFAPPSVGHFVVTVAIQTHPLAMGIRKEQIRGWRYMSFLVLLFLAFFYSFFYFFHSFLMFIVLSHR